MRTKMDLDEAVYTLLHVTEPDNILSDSGLVSAIRVMLASYFDLQGAYLGCKEDEDKVEKDISLSRGGVARHLEEVRSKFGDEYIAEAVERNEKYGKEFIDSFINSKGALG